MLEVAISAWQVKIEEFNDIANAQERKILGIGNALFEAEKQGEAAHGQPSKMKLGLTVFAAFLAAAGVALSRSPHRLPENYRDWLEWKPSQDRRPFLIRLLSAPSMWFDVGVKKGKVHVGGDGLVGGIRGKDDEPVTVKDLIPEKFGAGVSFGADL